MKNLLTDGGAVVYLRMFWSVIGRDGRNGRKKAWDERLWCRGRNGAWVVCPWGGGGRFGLAGAGAVGGVERATRGRGDAVAGGEVEYGGRDLPGTMTIIAVPALFLLEGRHS